MPIRTLIFAGILFLSSFTQAAEAPVGTMTSLRGDVSIKRPGREQGMAARTGAPLVIADVISTGRAAAAQVTFSDGAFVTLAPESSLRLNQFSFDEAQMRRTMTIKVISGRARIISFRPLGAGSVIRVMTDNALVSTGGSSDFVVSVSGRDTVVTVLERSVNVRNAFEMAVGNVSLGSNQFSTVRGQSPPSQPEVLSAGQRKQFVKMFRQ